MVAILIKCDVPRCGGMVRFEPRPRRSKNGRVVGSCERCDAVYTLHAGQVLRITDELPVEPLERSRQPRWR